MIIWLTGQSGAGKSTIAYQLRESLKKQDKPALVLDGDDMRRSVSRGLGFSHEDRRENNLRIARLAASLSAQDICVVVSVIAPLRDVRAEINAICSPLWIYVKKTMPEKAGHFYEPPSDYFEIDRDNVDSIEATVKIMELLDEN